MRREDSRLAFRTFTPAHVHTRMNTAPSLNCSTNAGPKGPGSLFLTYTGSQKLLSNLYVPRPTSSSSNFEELRHVGSRLSGARARPLRSDAALRPLGGKGVRRSM